MTTKKAPAKRAAPKPKAERKLRIAYIGNFGPEHSTENHVKRALEHNGHTVLPHQENDPSLWTALATFGPSEVDFVLWTRTGWDWTAYGRDQNGMQADQLRFLLRARDNGIPVIGFHLDIWWGLKREREVYTEPFFQSDLVITADGGHADRWLDAGIRHHWMPPAVSLAECELGHRDEEMASPVAFVGNWQGDYHPEHRHRHELVRWLENNFRRDCAFWPKPGQHAVRGEALRNLYQSVDVLVGDSCFAGTGLARYWSDRVPESLGRGGFLIHPYVEGMGEAGFGPGRMGIWTAGDWDALGHEIEWALANPDERKVQAAAGREHVMKHHTYERRMEQLVELLVERGLL